MESINIRSFKHAIRDIHRNTENRKFCFVIGSGASSKSGILTGGELAKLWFEEIRERLELTEFQNWIYSEKISENDLAAYYGTIYRKRFENDKTSGYEFLVQSMKNAKPSFGHIILAQILSKIPGTCVLTTNFDSLIESSVYQYTNKTPLVCGHESLSGYARPSKTHPLIMKIHRDLLLAPKSDPDEIQKLDKSWKEPLDHIFSTHIPIIVGYGGNDGSLMNYFENMNKPSNFFWCRLYKESLSERIESLVENHDGRFVEINSFDELMHDLLWVFDEIKPIQEELTKITNERIHIATIQLDSIISSTKHDNEEVNEIIIRKEKELSAFEYSDIALKEPDFEKREIIYLEALTEYPTTGWLWWSFTHFLHSIKKDYSKIEEYYQLGLESNKNEPLYIDNYAIYLSEIKGDIVKAEELFLKALSLDPSNEFVITHYANFLNRRKREFDKAEEYFNRLLTINPNNAQANILYAIFLNGVRKDYIKAEELYLKGLLLDPNNSNYNGYYAIFLKAIKNDRDKAEEYYRKSLALNSTTPNFNGNYAQILLEKGDTKNAEKFLDIALQEDDENGLLLEIWFYKYAHYPNYMEEAERKINELLCKGIRSEGWDFSKNIEKAIEMGHPNPDKLKEYARKISEPQS